MAEIRDVSNGEVVEATKPLNPQSKGVLDVPASDPLEAEVGQFFGLETESDKTRYEGKIKDVLAWAKSQTEDHSPENLKWVLRDLEFKMGSPALGEKMIDYLHSYVGLVKQKEEVESKLKKYNPYAK